MNFIEDKLKNKQKRLNKNKQINCINLETIHNEKVKYFNDLQEKILPEKLKLLEKYKKDNCDIYTIQTIQNDIYKIINKEEELQYYFNCLDILNYYFSNNNKITDEMLYKYYTYNNIDYQHNNLIQKYISQSIINNEKCNNCNNLLEISRNESELLCYTCNISKLGVYGSEKDTRSFNEQKESPIFVKKKFCYERHSYFKECLLKIQGKIPINIPNTILDQIKEQINIEKIGYSNLNITNIKRILKLKKLSKYNEYIPYIIKLITGKYDLDISEENQYKLLFMFDITNSLYEIYKPPNYSSTLPINYCFYKLAQILKQYSYLPYFPLLKDKKLIKERDLIWRKIINHIKEYGIDYSEFPDYKYNLDIEWDYHETI